MCWSHTSELSLFSLVYRHWKKPSMSNLSSLCGTSLLLLRRNWSCITGTLHFMVTQMTEIPFQFWMVLQKRPRHQRNLKYQKTKIQPLLDAGDFFSAGLPEIESDSSDSELLKSDVVEDDYLSVSESDSAKYVDMMPILISLLKLG